MKCDPEFEELLNKLTHRDVVNGVKEAFNHLFSAKICKDSHLNLTPEGCMIVSLVLQILIRLLTKRLINVMTTESFILNHYKIPYSYLRHYLSSQAHFSLKKAISNYCETLKATLM